jgi:hypothetical protein
VGRARQALPRVREQFAAGRLSYSKVRALTRIATPHTEPDLVDLARHATAAQVERLAAGYRRAASPDEQTARHARRYLRHHWDDDGSLIIRGRLSPDDGALFLAALRAARDAAAGDARPGGAQPAARPADPAAEPPHTSGGHQGDDTGEQTAAPAHDSAETPADDPAETPAHDPAEPLPPPVDPGGTPPPRRPGRPAPGRTTIPRNPHRRPRMRPGGPTPTRCW